MACLFQNLIMGYQGAMKQIALALAVLFILAGPVGAIETEWVEISPDASMRLIADNKMAPDGTTRLALEIKMPSSVKTYWRIPGEGGLPLRLDLSRSTGLGNVEISWPFPLREKKYGLLSHVFYGDIVIPISARLAPDAQNALVRAEVNVGICSDICIPANASFELALDFEKVSRANAMRIDIASAGVPIAPPPGLPGFGAVRIGADGQSLEIERLGVSDEIAASVILDTGPNGWFFGPPQIGPDSRLLRVPIRYGGDAGELLGTSATITFQTIDGPYEVKSRILPPA
jgi:DsbC/DsbD-like thiol-disulfide interchange protein